MTLSEFDKKVNEILNRQEDSTPLLITWFQDAYVKQKPVPENGKFIEIIIQDYSYADDLASALQFLWLSIYKENNHLIGHKAYSSRTIPDMIIELHNANKLEDLIIYTWKLMGRLLEIPLAVCGLASKEINWGTTGFVLPFKNTKGIYDNITITVYDNNRFTVGKNYNSERVWWNLETGRAEPF